MKVTSAEFRQNVGRYLDAAMRERVIITKDGHDQTVLVSAMVFEILVHGRVAQRMEDLDDESLNALAAAEVPQHFAYLDNLDLGKESRLPLPTLHPAIQCDLTPSFVKDPASFTNSKGSADNSFAVNFRPR